MFAHERGATSTTRKSHYPPFLSSPDIDVCHYRLQTPVYVLYNVPTIVSAAILLTTRHLHISLPSTPPNCWWELFDAVWEDVWSVCGYIMRLYRVRGEDERRAVVGMVSKKDVRKWLEDREAERSGT